MFSARLIISVLMLAAGVFLIVLGIDRTHAPGAIAADVFHTSWHASPMFSLIVPGLAFGLGGAVLLVYLALHRATRP